jgi:hypothetical protein
MIEDRSVNNARSTNPAGAMSDAAACPISP